MLSQDDVIYQIVTDRFSDGDRSNNGMTDRTDPLQRHGGDLLGIVHRMPYLRDLGVTALWISPVYVNSEDGYHGYHPLDFEKVDPHLCSRSLGAPASRQNVRRFVEIAHEHGLKVMLDVIVSHTAVNHPWLKSRPDWFHQPGSLDPEKNWVWGLPNLNHGNIDVNLYFAKNVIDWIADTDADAIRIDAARHVEKRFWEVFKLFAKGLYPDTTIVGEVWDISPSVVAPYQDTYDFDSMFDYPLYEAIVDVFAKDQPFFRLARPELSDCEPEGILNQDEAYRNAYKLLTFVGNHDNPRFFSIANGESDLEAAWQRMKLAWTFLFSTRGIPQLYYGDELAMAGGPDPENRHDMPWLLVDDQTLSSEEAVLARTAYDWMKELIRMRRSSRALCYGLLTTLYVTPSIYAFARCFFDDDRIVVLNNSQHPIDINIPIHANTNLSLIAKKNLSEGLELVDELDTTGQTRTRVKAGSLHVQLAARTGAVFSPTPPAK